MHCINPRINGLSHKHCEQNYSLRGIPNIEIAYNLSDGLRKIYNQYLDLNIARLKFARWFDQIEKARLDSFNSIKRTFEVHHKQIINYFISRSTNTFAESFNVKIKEFRR
ncbi:transposase [Ancylomarina sp. YFZ004]